MSIELRQYQSQTINKIRPLWASGKKKIAIQLPTGGG